MAETEIPEDVSKPAWCPRDIWHETGMQFDLLYDAEPDLEGGCEVGIRVMAARAILAERERCADIARSNAHADCMVAEQISTMILSS